MPSLLRSLVVLALFAFSAVACLGQVQSGTPPFGSFGGGLDAVNEGNNNVHWVVPVLHKAGRGTDFSYDLAYDSSVWYPVTSGSTTTWTPNKLGWVASTPTGGGYVTYKTQSKTCRFFQETQWVTESYTLYTYWRYVDAFGTSHVLNGGIQDGGAPDCGPANFATLPTNDGSGYKLSVPDPYTLYNVKGAIGLIDSGTYTDRNGNKVTQSGGVFTDTLGTTALTVTGSGTASSPYVFTYTPPSGGSASYTMKYATHAVKTNFGCNGVAEYGPINNDLVSEIDLPDGTKYTFSYEATPGFSGDVTGRLASVTLPTGGTISYSYSGGNNGINCADGSAATLTRTTPDGTWTYAHSQVSSTHWQTKVTTPADSQNPGSVGDDTVIDFQQDSNATGTTSNTFETQRLAYQGSSSSGTLLRTTTICYNTNTTNCTTTAVSSPITQRNVTTILPGTANLQAQSIYKYNSSGSLIEQDDYDWGSGTIGSLLKKTAITMASLGNNISAFRQSVVVTNGSGATVSQTNYNYDETAVVATSGTPQHGSISGSRGNLTSINYYTNGSTFLTKRMSYFDTGKVQTITDVNNAQTTYTYGACGNSFLTSVSEPLSLSRSMTWNCTGGVQLTSVDENNKTTTTAYTDLYFWRPASVTDPTSAVVNLTYTGETQAEAALVFNSGSSTSDALGTLDGLGRKHIAQLRETPGGTNFDSTETDHDTFGRVSRVTLPYVAASGVTNSSAPAKFTIYDALNRVLKISDSSTGYRSFSYSQNDVYVTRGPAATGEINPKRRQEEYDALGRLTSVCEITSAAGSGTCGQHNAQPGFWTKYTYDALGRMTSVTQNAQGTAQTRSYSYDLLGRLTSETNPESGTTTYVYDFSGSSFCGGYTSNGDLVRKVDAIGTSTCDFYDSLHRLTDVGTTRGSIDSCKRFRYDNTGGVLGSRPSGVTVSNMLGRVTEVETDTCAWPITQSSIITDEWFSYTARGEVSDFYESTPHSGGYYHQAATYWANGVINQLNGAGGYTVQYNLDGEGRVYSTAPSVYALSSTLYNAASQPTQLTFATSDTDNFTYDSNTNRMTQYKFNVNGQSVIGNLTWNPNGTLASLAITDPFNSANAQTCNYSHDDLTRIASVNCGASKWQQNFSYDSFGNLTKTVPTGGTGYSFQPTYSSSTNHMTLIGGSAPSYDANGNVLNDFLHSYTWNADGRPITIDGVSITYDALGRMVERNNSGAYSEIVYAPTGAKIEVMNGQSYVKSFAPLPGGAMAVWGGGIGWYRHADHLGSSRFASTSTRTVYFDGAYAPFGEPYAQTGSTDLSFTGMNQDTVSNLYDFPAREYGIQGRWPSPDPSGLASVRLSDPQTLNRYAYVRNNPLAMVDPNGLCGEEGDEACSDTDANGNSGGGGGGGGGGSSDPTSGGAMDDSGASCLPGSATCGGFVDSPLVDQTGTLTAGGFDSNGDYLTNLPLPDLSSMTSTDTSTWQDQQLQGLQPGILQGAGSIGDPSTYEIWFGASILVGAAPSAGALYEAGASIYTDLGANLITWQTGGLAGSTDAGFAEAFDILSNAGASSFSVSGTSAGAYIGAGISLLLGPPAYDPPWKGVPYPSQGPH
jgi:RHS repeat-associated protein